MTVYVLTYGWYSDYRIVAIYSTRERAEAEMARRKAELRYESSEYEVEEFELDPD